MRDHDRAGCVPAHTELLWRTHMHPLTLVCIVLLAAVLWTAFICGMLARLARSERRAGLRDPRKSAGDSVRRHRTASRSRLTARYRRATRRRRPARPRPTR
jgi:hypothetical protein